MVASPKASASTRVPLNIRWEKLPDDYVLPDDPVDNIYQPLLAEALRDGLREVGVATDQTLMPTNYGIAVRVNDKVAVKAPDWTFIPRINTTLSEVERSYTPQLQGDFPVIVMEFLSETDGGEYSSKQTYPYGKWFFYEQVLKVSNYVIFDIDGGLLEFYRLRENQYRLEQPNSDGRHWIEEMGLFLGTWQGSRDGRTGYWLRWWTAGGELVPWIKEQAKRETARADRLAEYLRSQGIDPDSI